MNKFKLIIFLVLSLLISGSIFAAELTTEQKKFRASLQEFLKEEGFIPTIDDEDNSINFKKEGTQYWLSIGGSNPLYIEFHRSGLKCEDADKTLVLQAINAANRKVRCAKAMFNDTSISFAIEMYCHSAEEFRYIFYKCMKELESIKDEVSDFYNNQNSASINVSPNGSASSSSTSLINKFFPVYDITLGKTTLSALRSLGYNVETDKDGDSHTYVHDLSVWDFNEDKIIDFINIDKSDTMPQKWINLGLSWKLSYNQVLSKLKELGFKVEVEEGPLTKEYSGRNTLSAKVCATSSDGKFKLDVVFNYGNCNGEGYTTNSPNTLYEMTFRWRK